MKTINNIGLWECVKSLHPNADFSIVTGQIIWREKDIPCPTNEKLEAEQTKLLADYDAKKYQRDRLAEYPSIQELVVALYDADDKAEIDKKRAEIKKKYPKPE